MTPERARQFLAIQVNFGGGYNANSAKLVLSEIQKEYGQAMVDQLIREMKLDRVFGFEPGTRFENGIALKG